MSRLNREDDLLIDACYDLAQRLVRNAGVLVREGFQKTIADVEVSEKVANWDLVTEYDHKVEEELIAGIKAVYPNHRFIAEESEATNEALTDAPTWVIDPIDGTNNFVRRLPLVAISVAFVLKKEICVGIIYNPVLDEFYAARLGRGATLNGKAIHTSNVKTLGSATLGHEVSFIHLEKYRERNIKQVNKLATAAAGFRSFGSACVSLSYVARGTLDGYQVSELYAWDIAAGSLLIREAGGFVCNPEGKPIDLNDPRILCAGTENLLKELVEANKDV